MTTPAIDMADLANKISQAPAKPADDLDIPEPFQRLEFHPLANEFPLMEGLEFDELVDDIRANGLLEPIVMFEGKILDGRNRYRAVMGQARYKFVPTNFVKLPKGVNPTGYVISKNIRRRHISPEKRREIIAKLLKLNPEASDRQIAAQVNASHHTVADVRAEQETTGQIAQLPKRVGRDGKKRQRGKQKRTGLTNKQLFNQVEAFRQKWEGFNDWQKLNFVKAYKDEIAELVDQVEAEEEAAEEGQEEARPN